MAAPDLFAIRRAYGGAVYAGGRQWIGPGPGHSRRDRSLSVRLSDDGRPLLHSFAGDTFAACAAYLGFECNAAPANRADLAIIRRAREAERRLEARAARDFCGMVWDGTSPIEGTPAEAYLWSRGLINEGYALRFHPSAPRTRRPDGAPPHPAMVALVCNLHGEAIGLHATYLTPNGRKAFGARSRLMFGFIAGGAVRLAPVGRDGALAIGEGIETSAAFAALHGLPTWAALSSSMLQSFEVPYGVRRLVVAADSDDSGAGHAAALVLAERARKRCEVMLAPAPQGSDWADVWTRRAP